MTRLFFSRLKANFWEALLFMLFAIGIVAISAAFVGVGLLVYWATGYAAAGVVAVVASVFLGFLVFISFDEALQERDDA